MSGKIDTDLPVDVLVLLAQACGFQVSYDRRPAADEWTLSAGHGIAHRQFTGTRQVVCAFLSGYAEMRIRATQALNEIEAAQRDLVNDARVRLGGPVK